MIKRLFSKRPANKGDYRAQIEALQSANVKERLKLARDKNAPKEVLYYLGEKDPDPKVRKAVAENRAMPVQVSPVMATDTDQDVRMALARRLVDLLPDISQDKHSQLYAFIVQSLGTLALDEVLKIRVALSSTLKDHAHTPPKVAGQLARDIEREVSEPILRFCAALSDEDLLDILTSHKGDWVVTAIAGRSNVSEQVSQAVIDTENRPGGETLIGNDGAKISESLLVQIVEMAKQFPEWHKPMALRKSLPLSIAKQMAEFVDASVRDMLLRRGDFDTLAIEEMTAVFRRRMDFAAEEETESVEMRIARMVKDGSLGEDAISDAIAMRDRDFVFGALAYLARTDMDTVKRIFEMKAPKPIVALAWKAHLSMRMALSLQKDVAHLQPKEQILPRGGTDYPLSDDDLNWQLEFLGLKKRK